MLSAKMDQSTRLKVRFGFICLKLLGTDSGTDSKQSEQIWSD